MRLSNDEGGSFQRQVLLKFAALWFLRQQWGGSLIVSCGLDSEGAALALAANIAGAVCLSIEPDVELLKAALRSGACDFAVNTLDEALRTMKNEVRKAMPLSVGLRGSIADVLVEIVERGLLPAVAADLSLPVREDTRPMMLRLQEMGTRILDFDGRKPVPDALDPALLLRKELQQHGWRLRCFVAESRNDLRTLDDALEKLITPKDTLRTRWLQGARLHFLRERPLCRAIWLNASEETALTGDTQLPF